MPPAAAAAAAAALAVAVGARKAARSAASSNAKLAPGPEPIGQRRKLKLIPPLKAVYDIIVSSADSTGALYTGDDILSLHYRATIGFKP